jgi:hypothetical protein
MDGIGIQNRHSFSIEKFATSDESEGARRNVPSWFGYAWRVDIGDDGVVRG